MGNTLHPLGSDSIAAAGLRFESQLLKSQDHEDRLYRLANETHFATDELRMLSNQFHDEVPSGAMSFEDCRRLLNVVGVVDPVLQEMLIRLFDVSGTGHVTFDDYARAMSVMTRGRDDEKVEFSFRMLDVRGEGRVTPEDVFVVYDSVIRATGHVEFHGSEIRFTRPDDAARHFFHLVDPSGKMEAITLDDYRRLAMGNPDVSGGLSLEIFQSPLHRR